MSSETLAKIAEINRRLDALETQAAKRRRRKPPTPKTPTPEEKT